MHLRWVDRFLGGLELDAINREVLDRILPDVGVPAGREPAEDDREDEDEDDAEEEAGNGDAADRDDHQQAVDEGVGADRGHDAGRDRQQHGERQRIEGEQPRRFGALQQCLGDRHPQKQGVPEIEPEGLAEPVGELHQARLVEPEPLAQRLLLLERRVAPEHDRGRIAREHAHQEEDDDADDEQHRYQEQQPADDEGSHGSSPLGANPRSVRRGRRAGEGPAGGAVPVIAPPAKPGPTTARASSW